MNILIVGITGAMGKNLIEAIKETDNMQVVAGVGRKKPDNMKIYSDFSNITESIDIIIDFSLPELLDDMLEFATTNNIPIVIATTGYNESQEEKIKKTSEKIAIFKTGNMSYGIYVLQKCANIMAKLLDEYDIEIIEMHHNQKKDAPSGTAKMLFDAVNIDKKAMVFDRHGKKEKRSKKEIGISTIRAGTITGEHSIIFAGNDEVLTINHSARSKKIFAQGALKAAQFLQSKKNGLYNMNDLIN